MIQADIPELNRVYSALQDKLTELTQGLSHRIFRLEAGWHNGHYTKGAAGAWQMDFYPIPVLTVTNLCDIEIGLSEITVSTKLNRETALEYSFSKFSGIPFEAFSVKDYHVDYYTEEMTMEQFHTNLKNSGEAEIGIQFRLPFEITGEGLYDFCKLLRKEKFFY